MAEPAVFDNLRVEAGEPVEDVSERLYTLGLSDGLPVVPPTAERVRRLYTAAHLDPVEHAGVLEPSLAPIRVYHLAVCAVMAGCRPEHLPLILAAVRAMVDPAFNLLGIQTTTGAAAPVWIVNGPASAGVSGGADCLGLGAQANLTVGRALRLVLLALAGGGSGPAGMDLATMGSPAKRGLCFAENEARSPWEPLRLERGFGLDDTVVTAVGVSGSVEIVHATSLEPEEILATVAGSMTIAGSAGGSGLLGGGQPLLLLSYEHADALAAAGMSKDDVKRWLYARARLPLTALGPETAAALAGSAEGGSLRIARSPDDILILVAGGVGVKSTFLPSWGGGTRASSVRVLV